jgi:hypothetical protein
MIYNGQYPAVLQKITPHLEALYTGFDFMPPSSFLPNAFHLLFTPFQTFGPGPF